MPYYRNKDIFLDSRIRTLYSDERDEGGESQSISQSESQSEISIKVLNFKLTKLTQNEELITLAKLRYTLKDDEKSLRSINIQQENLEILRIDNLCKGEGYRKTESENNIINKNTTPVSAKITISNQYQHGHILNIDITCNPHNIISFSFDSNSFKTQSKYKLLMELSNIIAIVILSVIDLFYFKKIFADPCNYSKLSIGCMFLKSMFSYTLLIYFVSKGHFTAYFKAPESIIILWALKFIFVDLHTFMFLTNKLYPSFCKRIYIYMTIYLISMLIYTIILFKINYFYFNIIILIINMQYIPQIILNHIIRRRKVLKPMFIILESLTRLILISYIILFKNMFNYKALVNYYYYTFLIINVIHIILLLKQYYISSRICKYLDCCDETPAVVGCNIQVDKVCSICQDCINTEEAYLETPCNHYYHKDCINPWLKHNSTCPECRESVPPLEIDYD